MKMKLSLAIAVLALTAFALLWVTPLHSWLVDYVLPSGGGTPQEAHWDFSAFRVEWNLNPSTSSKCGAASSDPCIQGSRPLAEVIQASVDTWSSAPNTSIAVFRGADSNLTALPPTSSGTNLICFVCADESLKDPQTLAVTFTTEATAPGQADGHGGTSRFPAQILSSSILFNPSVSFNTDTSPDDLQNVATHEFGHFLGLSHSAIVRAMMFPSSPDEVRTLSYDDVAAISTEYPKSSPSPVPGSISGSVRLASGSGVFGAHVHANSVTSALPFGSGVRKSPIGAMTFPDGSYTIKGVPPDSYIVIAEPLDDPVVNSDLGDFAATFGRGAVQTNFTTRWH